jgi:hypothetical protein
VANKLLIHYITTYIANVTVARNSGVVVPSSPTTTSLQVASWSSGTFFYHYCLSPPSFLFILMFFTRCRFSIHRRPVIHSRTSSTARTEVVAPTPTTQMTVTVLFDSSCDNYVMHECVVNFVPSLVFEF